MYIFSGYPRWRFFFIFILHSSLENIWRNLLTNGYSAVNGCRQKESKQLIKTQVIHTTPGHQLMSCEMKSCVFVRNKSIIKTLTSNKSSFYNTVFFGKKKKKIQERNMHRSSTVYTKSVLNKYVGEVWCQRTIGEGIIMDYVIIFWQEVSVY